MKFTAKKEAKRARKTWKKQGKGLVCSDGAFVTKARAVFKVQGQTHQFTKSEVMALWGQCGGGIRMMKKLEN